MVLMTKMTKELDLFHDTGPAFEKYLRANEADEVAARHGLVRRKDHTIIHKVGALYHNFVSDFQVFDWIGSDHRITLYCRGSI